MGLTEEQGFYTSKSFLPRVRLFSTLILSLSLSLVLMIILAVL